MNKTGIPCTCALHVIKDQYIPTSTVISKTTHIEKFKRHIFFFLNNYVRLDVLSYVPLADQNTE